MLNTYLSCQYPPSKYHVVFMSKRYINNIYMTIFLLSLLLINSMSNLALAKYVLPPVIERYHVLTNTWQLGNSNDKDSVAVKRNGKNYVWTIDPILLADRVNSESICIGTNESVTRSYLDKLSALPAHKEVIIELVNNKKGAPLVVAGIWVYDADMQWQHAIKYGSPTLSLSAAKVKTLGSATKYHKKVLQFCDQEWTKINGIPRAE